LFFLASYGTFGEMALIDTSPRSAAAIAAEPTEVAVIDRDTFLVLVAHHPPSRPTSCASSPTASGA
jgi:CRP-like cAMP-binding protein